MSLNLQSTATNLLNKLAITQASGDLKVVQVLQVKNSLTGEVTFNNTDFNVAGAVTEYNLYEQEKQTVAKGDKKIVIQAGVVVPTTQDQIKFENVAYAILDVQTKYSGIIPQVYVLQCRGKK